MKLGTKSILFGVHQFILHPIFVAIAYTRLYGFSFDIRIWVAFIVHDWGYWGKFDMDGEEGKIHPELGAIIMHKLFDSKTLICDLETYRGGIYCTYSKKWSDFTLYHSRFYATRDEINPSKLCYADKLAFCICPCWLFIILTNLTGEIHEYMNKSQDTPSVLVHSIKNQKAWYDQIYTHIKNWVGRNYNN